ncbi:MAG: Re/Si-specific NAD(P)(+) transhydrogenase subunit alpha [Nitrososphaerota archaeon]|nr:Re/Si-specific NAD(P)(+) transhydrogenase subunit alpha [Nitrososphaerota archaeon]
MIVGVPKETVSDENRVSLVPDSISKLKGIGVVVETGAGVASGYSDQAYAEAGATIVSRQLELYLTADVILKVQAPTEQEVELMKDGATLISFLYPVKNLGVIKALKERNVNAFAMDLVPRISRAQSMDALSSQSTVAGYKAVVLAAFHLPRLFPMLMTAAGTITPAKVFVVGAGVAGLQAIAVARRLGGVVEAYDVRPLVKEQVTSLGAKFVEIPVDSKDSQDAGGYAKAQTSDFNMKQQQFLAERARVSDVVITTALIPGQKAPILISEDAVKGMRFGSVVVDLAAEAGGNCALTEPGKTVVKYGVTIDGSLNLPSTMAQQSSQLFAKNVTSFLLAIVKDGRIELDLKDDLIRGSLVTSKGEVLHPATKAAIGNITK